MVTSKMLFRDPALKWSAPTERDAVIDRMLGEYVTTAETFVAKLDDVSDKVHTLQAIFEFLKVRAGSISDRGVFRFDRDLRDAEIGPLHELTAFSDLLDQDRINRFLDALRVIRKRVDARTKAHERRAATLEPEHVA